MNPMSWTPDDATLNLIRHMAIQNAIEYEGKASPGSVIGRIMGMNADLRPHGKMISPMIAKAVAEANNLAGSQGIEHLRGILENEAPHLLEERQKKERRVGLPELPNAEKGKVVLRFACSSDSSERICTRRAASRFDSGSSIKKATGSLTIALPKAAL